MIVLFPLLLMLIGALMWALCTNPILKDMGRGAFFIGLFVFTLRFDGGMLKLIG